ncbi:leucine rich repeat LRR-containing protein [Nitzschia inconspicua]|uniref:non-specific serine/threonine protein kinase n=1 Tax=Nitzschia inconspicua TaxID=303405 RepID=A0A9K3LRW1_9STRA|nr:leucine rich repeat LRR-containing protein [Nitzschia inconspicua]
MAANPFDAESVDMENSVYDETPETNYFKMMMQENEAGRITSDDRDAEDSVLGGVTLASMLGNDKQKKKKFSAPPPESYAVPHHNPSPAETLSIVGVEDDVSTIANDTVNETTKAFFNSHGTKEASQPRIRLFKEYKTPEKSKKKSESSTEDDETAPETPPGMIRVPGRSSQASEETASSKSSKKQMKSSPPPVRSKRVYIVAGVLAVILFASIIALSVALSGMRDTSSSGSVSAVEEDEDVFDTWPDLDIGDLGTGAPTFSDSTSGPVASPLDTDATFDELYRLLLNRGVISEDVEEDPNSPQLQAMIWLSEDQNFYNYLEHRMLQRWTLAVLYYSMNPTDVSRGRKHRGLVDGWLEYTNECLWFTSGQRDPCDDSGNFERLNIQQSNLGGSLPSEIALLSNSLRYINLDGNNLQGAIPTSLAQLTLLELLSIRQNSLVGTIISEIGALTNLLRLNLGRNQLSGIIPPEIGDLTSLEILRLDQNDLIGEIPVEIGNLAATLVSLSLNGNSLSGRIPIEISTMTTLKELYIGNNDLSGDLPRDVCRLSELEVISVDCEAQDCRCCTECAEDVIETASPTLTPTAEILETESPTLTPTAETLAPSPAPTTSDPTPCLDTIKALDTCYTPGEAIDLIFSSCNPVEDDWVGIFLSDKDVTQLPNPPVWSWACGTRNCREAVNTQEMSLSQVHAASNAWPLDEGEYFLILARNSAQPYTAFAVSDTFSVQRIC